jgi:PAS domain S-box-containing protein
VTSPPGSLFARFKIRAKLLAAFVAVALFTGALGLYAVNTIERLNQGQRTVFGDVYGGTHLLATWVDISWEARSVLLTDLLSEDAAVWRGTRAQMETLDARLRDIAQQMDAADTDREDVETLANLNAAWQDYVSWRDTRVIGPLEGGDRAAAIQAYRTESLNLTQQIDATIDAFLQKKQQVGSQLQADAEVSYEVARRIAILLSGAAVLLGLFVGYFMSRTISHSAGQMATAAKGLAVGDLDQRIQVASRDEIGELGDAFKEMIAYQQDMARVADAMARGDLSQNVRPKAASDRLGTAFQRMIANLRTLVAQLEDTARRANTLAEVAEEREARVRAVMDSVADAIITFDVEGRIEAFNPTAERFFGYTGQEVVGQNLSMLLVDGREPLTFGTRLEMTGRRRDGAAFPIEVVVSAMRLGGHRLSIASIRDISERKQTEAAQRLLAEATALLAASLDYEATLASVARLAVPFMADGCAIGMVDENEGSTIHPLVAIGDASDGDRGWPSRLGPLAEHVVRTGRTLVHPDIASGELPAGVSVTALRRAGLTSLMLVPLMARGRPLGVLTFIARESHRNFGAHDLSLAEELARRCALAVENARLYREAQQAIRLRDDFFSVASHELKTPVAALMAFTQFLRKRAERRGRLTTAQISDALQEVHWQSDRIARLVGQLLDTSRLDAGKLTLEPELTDLTAMVRGAVHAARASTRGHTIRVRAPGPVWARVDALRVEQVITNLLDNAIKYSPEGGPVEIELSRSDAQTVRLAVRDHGIGVPAEHRPHIFDRFYQAHAGRHFAGVAGMGLGLYISRRIVEMHGGSIDLQAPASGGSRVIVHLPAEPQQQDAPTELLEPADAIAQVG